MNESIHPVEKNTTCSHCGDGCTAGEYTLDSAVFCCAGCRTVYALLTENGLGKFYTLNEKPSFSQKFQSYKSYDFADDETTEEKLLVFKEDRICKIVLTLPQIHCSSCLYLLENIQKIDPGIKNSRVNFQRKEVTLVYDKGAIKTSEVLSLLSKIGYPPDLHLKNLDKKSSAKVQDKRLLYQIGLAGFCFGNIMLLSFPEYLGYHKASLHMYIGYINILLSIPVLLFSGRDYLTSAYRGLKFKNPNIDVPIALGMIVLFGRSAVEILFGWGEGYLDSFSGFVFFLLIGKWFQSATYQTLDFNRTYTSFFPMSVSIKEGDTIKTRAIDQVSEGDVLLIKNEEIIPADGRLTSSSAKIDYSYVTGESRPIYKKYGEMIYAGGKVLGRSIEVCTAKKIDQSEIVKLWNNDAFSRTNTSNIPSGIDVAGRYFTIAIICIAVLTFGFWITQDTYKAFEAFTAVLIVACPCALALVIPFAYGNLLRLLANRGLFLKNVHVIEKIQRADHLVLDKTGTMTDGTRLEVRYEGSVLAKEDREFLFAATRQSSHPISLAIHRNLGQPAIWNLDGFSELAGKGIWATCHGRRLRLGSSAYIFETESLDSDTASFLEIDGRYFGKFTFTHEFREGITDLVSNFDAERVSVLSGDKDFQRSAVREMLGPGAVLNFDQSPEDKLKYIQTLRAEGQNILMLGDGLNDAGALKESDIGIALTEAKHQFSPSCDGILAAGAFDRMGMLIKKIRSAQKIVHLAFFLAFVYNGIGLYFAVTGQLKPVIAAILMPLSSITIVVFSVASTYYLMHKK